MYFLFKHLYQDARPSPNYNQLRSFYGDIAKNVKLMRTNKLLLFFNFSMSTKQVLHFEAKT